MKKHQRQQHIYMYIVLYNEHTVKSALVATSIRQ